jgi:hypothetical protein
MSDPTPPVPPEPAAPTAAERAGLVAALQRAAAARPDPVAANLGVVLGDVLRVAHLMADRPLAALADGPPGPVRREADTYLKVVREVDRIARLDRLVARPAE